jgi:predicted transcriptional regulator
MDLDLDSENDSSDLKAKDQNLSSQGKYQVEIPLEKGIIGRLIKALREIRNYSQTRLGRLIGVKRAQISKFETGNGNLTLSSLLKLFSALRARVSFKLEVEKKKDAKILEEVKSRVSEVPGTDDN